MASKRQRNRVSAPPREVGRYRANRDRYVDSIDVHRHRLHAGRTDVLAGLRHQFQWRERMDARRRRYAARIQSGPWASTGTGPCTWPHSYTIAVTGSDTGSVTISCAGTHTGACSNSCSYTVTGPWAVTVSRTYADSSW